MDTSYNFMKKYILFLLVVVGLIGRVDAQGVAYYSSPYSYYLSTSTVETDAVFFSRSNPETVGFYDTDILYSALPSGAVLSIYLPDTSRVYGPGSFDSWSKGVASGGSVPFTLNGASSGGSLSVTTKGAISSATLQYTIDTEVVTEYENTIYYSDLPSGAVLSIYLPDTSSVSGPYSSDSWSKGVASGGSVPFTLNGASSGGSFEVSTQSAVTDASIASVPEPSTYALFGLGLVTLLAVRRKRLC